MSDLKDMNNLISQFSTKMGFEENVIENEIQKSWIDIVGKLAVNSVSIIKLKYGILYLKSSSPAWKMEILIRKSKIVEKINATFGKNVVSDIDIK